MKTGLSHEVVQRLHERFSAVFEPEQILADENMSAHTTFRVGGAADIFVEIDSAASLAKALGILKSEGLTRLNTDFYILGNGSNLLVSDSGLRGVVLHLSKQFDHIRVEGTMLVCEAGATLAAIARKACENGLDGFSFAAGIPGSLGGAIVMNAGAYGGEMKQVVKSVRLMNMDGEIIEKSAEEMHFSYRHSLVKESMSLSPLVVLEVTIALTEGRRENIQAQMEALAGKRREKQPLEYPSAGSTFKRPEGYFAGKLIDDAGLRGFSVGSAQVSEKHCGFVINRDNATAADIHALILEVQRRVKASSGVVLEPEVILLGNFE